MRRSAAVPVRRGAGTTLAAILLLCAPARLPAQEPADDAGVAPVRVELTTHDTYAGFHPLARLELGRPGYVALFEVEPGVGATMLYPDDPADPERLAAGTHELRLNGLPMALRRRLVVWHLGWALERRRRLVPRNHLVAVVSDEPLDVSALRSRRVFRYTKTTAGPGEVTGALLGAVTGDRPADRWDTARASYDKFRDPWLLASAGPWLDAPFLPRARELRFTGWPPVDGTGFLFTCGPEFAVTGEYVRGVTVHDLRLCRRVTPDEGLLADLNWQEAADPPRDRDALPGEVRETLRRIADATEQAGSWADLRSVRRLEAVGAELRARGIGVDAERLRTLRWRAESRARVLERLGVPAERARRLGVPVGRPPGPGSPGDRARRPGASERDLAPGDRGSAGRGAPRPARNPAARGSSDGSARASGGDARRPSGERIRQRARPPRPTPAKPPRSSSGKPQGESGGG